MNVLKMMKKDLTSVIGLKLEYDFGGSEPLIGIVAEARACSYQDSEGFVGLYYVISFSDHPLAFYGVYDKNIKIIEN